MSRVIYLALFAGSLLGCQVMRSVESNKLPSFEITLDENISAQKGIVWPKHSNGSPLEFKAIQEPCEILLHIPKGRQFKFNARDAVLKQNDGVVQSVRITVPVQAVEYEQAISILEAEYSKIAAQQDKNFTGDVERWKKSNPTPGWPDTRMSRVFLKDGVKLELGVETVYEGGADKWVSFFHFYTN
jgi:hypothetical protein